MYNVPYNTRKLFTFFGFRLLDSDCQSLIQKQTKIFENVNGIQTMHYILHSITLPASSLYIESRLSRLFLCAVCKHHYIIYQSQKFFYNNKYNIENQPAKQHMQYQSNNLPYEIFFCADSPHTTYFHIVLECLSINIDIKLFLLSV